MKVVHTPVYTDTPVYLGVMMMLQLANTWPLNLSYRSQDMSLRLL